MRASSSALQTRIPLVCHQTGLCAWVYVGGREGILYSVSLIPFFLALDGPSCCSTTTAPKEPTEAEIDEMMAAAPEGMDKINWIMFLTMFAEKMDGEISKHPDFSHISGLAISCFECL